MIPTNGGRHTNPVGNHPEKTYREIREVDGAFRISPRGHPMSQL